MPFHYSTAISGQVMYRTWGVINQEIDIEVQFLFKQALFAIIRHYNEPHFYNVILNSSLEHGVHCLPASRCTRLSLLNNISIKYNFRRKYLFSYFSESKIPFCFGLLGALPHRLSHLNHASAAEQAIE